MKALLKILVVFGLSTPLALNVVACGSDKSNSDDEVTENTNVQELLRKAKEQVNLGLGNLIDKNKNLTFEDQFVSLGSDITQYLNKISDNGDSLIQNNTIKSIFLSRLQKDINTFLIDEYLIQPSELKPLFGNIPINELLTIDINQTRLKEKTFQWDKDTDFGVAGYDPNNPEYNIKMWHKLTADLKLKLSYKNESNVKSTIEFNTDFTIDYANKGANLAKLIDASTANIEKTLRGAIIEVENSTNLKNQAITLILQKLNNAKISINKIELVTTTLRKYDKYDSGDYMFEAITKPTVEEAVALLQSHLTPVANEFKTKVADWIGTGTGAKKITANQDNINNFGTCTISNWTISDLTLKPMTLDFVSSRSNQTQSQWAEQAAKALGTIFCTKGSFAQGRIDLTTDNNLTIYMNPADFDNFVQGDKNMMDISDYIADKINVRAKAENIITNNITLLLNGLWEKNPTLSDRSSVEKVDDKTFSIKKNAGGMHGFNYLSIHYDNFSVLSGSVNNHKNKRILFNNWIIKKADTDVW